MKTFMIPALLITLTIGVVSLAASAAVNEQDCRSTIADTCTRCHGAARICNKLKDPGIDAQKWREIITRMGKKANLDQAAQDTVHTCLTTSADPGGLVCDK
jgi:cytochrome c553